MRIGNKYFVSSTAVKSSGFGLLEAIISLVLISISVMAVYNWINVNLISIGRLQAHAQQNLAENNVLAYLSNLNPMLKPQGTQKFIKYRVRWNSALIEPARDQVASSVGIGLYKVGLYQVTVHITRPDGKSWFQFHFKQAGYLQIRSNKHGFI